MAELTPRERILATVQGGPVDRIPAALWRHFPGQDTAADSLADAVIAFQREYGFDLVKITFASGYPAEAWGARLEPDQNREGTRRYVERRICNARDWHRLPLLGVDGPVLQMQLAALLKVRVGVGPDVHVLPTVFSPLTVAKQLAGQDVLMEHLHNRPADLHAGLRTVAATMAGFAAACMRHGGDGVFFATQLARHDLLTEEEYAVFGLPYDQTVLEAVAGGNALVVAHLCGSRPMLSLGARYGAHIVNWHDQAGGPSLQEGLAMLPSSAVLGGLDRERLATATPEQVAADVRRAVDDCGGRGRVVVGTGCVALQDTPVENFRAVSQAARSCRPD
jgi:uroporphyrinogen decarboxylase